MSQVSEIQTLQELDDQGATYRAALESVEAKIRGDAQLDEARRRLAAADTDLAPTKKDQVRVDGQLKMLSSKIETEEKRLYSGTVTNAKELQNIQHEVDSLKEQRLRLEDQLLEVELRLDSANREQMAAAQDVAEREKARSVHVEGWKHEVRGLNDSISRTDARREAQRIKIAPRALFVYEDVRRRRGGMAVARVQGSTCGACRIQMPDSVRKKAFNSDVLAQCPNCERILYLG